MRKSETVWLLAGLFAAIATGAAYWLMNVHWDWDLPWWTFLIVFVGTLGSASGQLMEIAAKESLIDGGSRPVGGEPPRPAEPADGASTRRG